MKKAVNIALTLVIIAAFVVAMTAPWWFVWFVCLPALWLATVALIEINKYWPDWLKREHDEK